MAVQPNIGNAAGDQAIVVGISLYPNLGSGGVSNNLGGPTNDAEEVAKWLIAEAGVPKENVTCITSLGIHNMVTGKVDKWPDNAVRPCREDIERPLYAMVREGLIARNTGPPTVRRRLWIYCAGHGFASVANTRDVSVVVADALHLGYIPNLALTKFADWVAQLGLFEEVVLWLDCCAEARPDVTLGEPVRHSVNISPTIAKRFFMGAAPFDRLAYEDTSQTPTRGIFTSRLLAALRGGVPLSKGGFVTTDAIRDFFRNMPLSGAGNPADLARPRAWEDDLLDLVHIGSVGATAIASTAPVYTIQLTPPDAPGAGTEVQILNAWLKPVGKRVVGNNGTIRLALAAGLYKIKGPRKYSRLFQILPEASAHVVAVQ